MLARRPTVMGDKQIQWSEGHSCGTYDNLASNWEATGKQLGMSGAEHPAQNLDERRRLVALYGVS